MDYEKIAALVSALKWPNVVSSDVRITVTSNSLVIEIPPMPLRFIYAWMSFTYLLIMALLLWKEPSVLPVAIPFGFLSAGGFCFIMRIIEKKRAEVGPYAIIGDQVRNYDGRILDTGDVTDGVEVFFTAKRRSGKENYRMVMLMGKDLVMPILWQITTRHRWTSPKLDLIEKRLGIKIITWQLKSVIDAP